MQSAGVTSVPDVRITTDALRVAGEQHVLEPGVFARVGASEKRKITTGAEGVQLLCVGAVPGQVYKPLPIVELGGPDGEEPRGFRYPP